MKASFLWIDGPFADHLIQKGASKIPLGPKSEDSLEVPGFTGPLPYATVVYENKHYYISPVSAPEGIFVNNTAIPATDRVELKGNAVVRFGAGGPRFKFGFEIEAKDLISHANDEEFDPSGALRRMQAALQQSGAKKHHVEEMKQSVHEADKRGKKRWGGAVLGGVVVALVIVVFVVIQSREQGERVAATEERVTQLSKMLAGVETSLSKSEEDFRRASAGSAPTDTVAQERIAKLEEEIADLRKKDPEKHRERIAKLEKELEGYRAIVLGLKDSHAALQKAFEKAVDSLVFIYAEWDLEAGGKTWLMSGFGTGFVIDTEGTVVTAKHVIHSWKYRDAHVSLANWGHRKWKRRGDARIMAWKVGDRFELDGKGDPKGPRWSTKDGTLSVVRVFDHLTPVKLADGNNNEFWADIEEGWDNDVAVLRLKGDALRPLALATREEIDQLKPLTPILVAGFPLGKDVFEKQKVIATPAVGHVRKVETTIQHSVPTCGGNSGGPLLNERGKVIGLVNAGFVDAQNLNISVTTVRIREMLKTR